MRPKPYEPFGGDINVKVDLSNYATKTDLKNESNLASLKTEVDKLYIDKITKLSLAKLSNVLKMALSKRLYFTN